MSDSYSPEEFMKHQRDLDEQEREGLRAHFDLLDAGLRASINEAEAASVERRKREGDIGPVQPGDAPQAYYVGLEGVAARCTVINPDTAGRCTRSVSHGGAHIDPNGAYFSLNALNDRARIEELRAREAAGEKIQWAERRSLPDPRSSIAQGVQLYKTTVRSYVMEWRSAYPMGCYAVVGKRMDRVCILERGHDNGKHESR